jgi:hypothetical protein
VPSSLPKPTFLPEPKSFSTKKVRLPKQNVILQITVCVRNVNLKMEQDWTCLIKMLFYKIRSTEVLR